MKGAINLSVNTVIIVVLAILVMLALIVFFQRGTEPGRQQMGDYDAWNRGCSKVRLKGCDESYFQSGGLNINGYDGDLAKACNNVFGYTDSQKCMNECCG